MKFITLVGLALGAAQLSSAWVVEAGNGRRRFTGRGDERCIAVDRSNRGPGHHRLFFDDEERPRRGPDRMCCVWVYKDDDCRERLDRAEEFCDRFDGETRGEFRSFSVDCGRVRGRRPPF